MDRPDSEPDEDDVSIPPGVILVTTPIDDLSHNEGLSNGYGNSMESSHGMYILNKCYIYAQSALYRVALQGAFNSLSPGIKIQILLTDLHAFSYSISWENL